MTLTSRKVASMFFAAAAAMALTACAGGREFQGTPQEGALRTGTYPTFGRMPKGATTQFTPEELDQMTGRLDSKRTSLKAGPSNGVSAAQAAAARKQAQEHNDAVLKQIESGEAQ